MSDIQKINVRNSALSVLGLSAKTISTRLQPSRSKKQAI